MIDAKPDAVFTRAGDINNRGEIVGDYATKPTTPSTTAAPHQPAPEPSNRSC